LKQVIIKKGNITVEETPAPKVAPGCVLMQTCFSCISTGTEIAGLKMSAKPLWKRALEQPENVKKVFNMVAQSGLKRTHAFVKGHLDAGNPTGYSASGIVIDVADDVNEFKIGDKVAGAGAEYAHHAEVLCIPKNLVVHIPEQLCMEHASTVTLGAIALQGTRRANPTLGETFIVLGLGILGQLTAQILKANGCQVIGFDLNNEKIEMAKANGLTAGILSEPGHDVDTVKRLTQGQGADGVIITAASNSSEVVSNAFQMCRRKGRVILVGDVNLDVKRQDIYAKELDFLVSCSYGPGRYDDSYEVHGQDYPIGYVRWTENRNMQAYLKLLANGQINLSNILSEKYPISQAAEAYAKAKEMNSSSLLSLLEYSPTNQSFEHITSNPLHKPIHLDTIKVAVVGAGGFAKGMHLPNLARLKNNYTIHAIASRTGHNANTCAKQYSAKYATTEYQKILSDHDINLVLLCTPHDQHAKQVEQAILANKHILVEKPLALNEADLQQLVRIVDQHKANCPIIMTGFNRRFSPHIVRLKQVLAERNNPMMINYKMNAGYIPMDHWVHSAKGGGRNIGEACHIYDLFTYLTDSKITSLNVSAISPKNHFYARNDNFNVCCEFADGSVANLMYTAMGHHQLAKETMEVYYDGCVAQLNDYKQLSFYGRKLKGLKTVNAEKGQLQELQQLAHAINTTCAWPIPWWQQIQAMQIAFDVEALINQKVKSSCAE